MIELERELIGSLLIYPKTYWNLDLPPGEVMGGYRKAYQAIGEMVKAGESVDPVSVSERCGADLSELIELTQGAKFSHTAVNSAKAIKARNHLSRSKKALQSALSALEEGNDVAPVIAKVVSDTKIENKGEIVTISEAIDQAISEVNSDVGKAVVNTGIATLDNIMKLSGGKLFVIGGRPGTFKSAFALKILMRNAINNRPTGMISLEMNPREMADRWLKMANIKSDLHNGLIGDAEKEKGRFSETPFYMDCTTFDFIRIESRIVEMVERYGCKCVIVDYLQLMKSDKQGQAYERIGEMTRGLKIMAQQLNIPIGILSQLNRMSEIDNRPPKLSDLRESGNIEQDADIVIFIHRWVDKDSGHDCFQAILAKQRGGRVGKIPLAIKADQYRIEELTYEDRN